jgi:hypothetical protein
MYNTQSSPTVTNCTFSGNSADAGGGMMNDDNCNPTVTNCTFSGNETVLQAGGMYNYKMSSPTVTNCLFDGNITGTDGGAMYNYWSSSPTITNCTFTDNSAIDNGGVFYTYWSSSPVVSNCILWGNTAPSGPQIYNDGPSSGSVTVAYSDVQGGWSGTGNINADPCFVDLTTADYHLLPGSPCIDAGDSTAVPTMVTTDLDGNARIVGSAVDMGAYELQNTPPVSDAGGSQTVHAGTVVTLDGSGSSDPDENYPLTYLWQITSKPEQSTAELSEPNVVNPSFLADLVGDYTVELIVTDSKGTQSTADTVLVSTFNTPPIPDPGGDQAVIEQGSEVQLDGTDSYDLDGDDMTYFWSITQAPEGSTAALSDACSPTPSFVADVYGDYVISLVVTDSLGAESNPQTVTVSFDNVPPVADAGGNQSAIVGDTVFLDGSGSHDGNFDPLTYSWNFVSKPPGSVAELSDANVVDPSFTADEPGAYVVSLVVNDGFVNSNPANVEIMAITTQDATAITLVETIETTNQLDPNSLKNDSLSNALTNKINAALEMIDQGFYQDALDKLQNDILNKTNGCAETGEPDRNDWIETCEEQSQVYPLVIEAIELLENLI